jgi:hypothetical protein
MKKNFMKTKTQKAKKKKKTAQMSKYALKKGSIK